MNSPIVLNFRFDLGRNTTSAPRFSISTSVPSKRNAFGSRTAWLPPCLKSLAVAVIDTDVDTGKLARCRGASVMASRLGPAAEDNSTLAIGVRVCYRNAQQKP